MFFLKKFALRLSQIFCQILRFQKRIDVMRFFHVREHDLFSVSLECYSSLVVSISVTILVRKNLMIFLQVCEYFHFFCSTF